MKNLFKLLGNIALVAVIGFIMVSCSTNSTKSTNNDDNNFDLNKWIKENNLGLVQMGMATQEMKTPGLTAAHSSIRIGSEARIRNRRNGKEVVVTITDRIAPSNTRVVDVSPETARALDFGPKGDPVIITGSRQ